MISTSSRWTLALVLASLSVVAGACGGDDANGPTDSGANEDGSTGPDAAIDANVADGDSRHDGGDSGDVENDAALVTDGGADARVDDAALTADGGDAQVEDAAVAEDGGVDSGDAELPDAGHPLTCATGGAALCADQASCADTGDGYVCTCGVGYVDTYGDGTLCEDDDECVAGTDACAAVATCTNTDGGYSCACPNGFVDTTGDGTSCEDIDECTAQPGPCASDVNATCRNTTGGFVCECGEGLYDVLGDGSYCAAPEHAVALGTSHTCAILQGGVVKCWGAAFFGELGLDRGVRRGNLPGQTGDALVAANLGGRAVQLAAGCSHTCALLEGGDVKCWGRNHQGQLGLGDTQPRGDGRRPCLAGSSVACTCSDPPTNLVCNEPLPMGVSEMGDYLDPVPLGGVAVGVTAGCEYSCALMEGGGVKCWGGSEYGQLGLGNQASIGDQPGEVESLGLIPLGGPVKTLRGGFRYVCAQFEDDTMKCWGRNQNGQLGQNNQNHRGDQPDEITTLLPINFGAGRTVKAFAAGYIHNCAILDNDSVKCWGGSIGGYGYGDLGVNRGDGLVQAMESVSGNEMGDVLATISLDGTPVALAAQHHTCVRFSDETISCFGVNGQGQLGLGDTANRSDGPNEMGLNLPRLTLGGSERVVAVFAGVDEDVARAHTCALLDSGALKCWGDNSTGQLGLGDESDRGDGPDEMGDALPVAMQLW